MYKKVLLVLLVLVMTNSVFADTSDWRFSKDIEETSIGYNEVILDNDIYSNSKDDLSDLRVEDSNSNFVPYYLKSYEIINDILIEEYPVIPSLIFKKDLDTYMDLEVIKSDENSDILVNELSILNSRIGEFLYDIQIYGSYDNKSWDFIQSDKIYRTRDSVKESIKFDQTYKYNYYRVVFLNVSEHFGYDGLLIKAINLEKTSSNKSLLKTKQVDYKVEQLEESTIIKIDNSDLLKVTNIKLNTNDNFDREYTLTNIVELPAGTTTANSKSYYNGRIYNIDLQNFKATDTDIEVDSLKGKSFEIEIYNNDSMPIEIESIDLTYTLDKLVFEVEEDNEYTLYFGNDKVSKPEYDIESFKNHINATDIHLAELSDIQENNDFKEVEETNNKPLLNVLVILIVILLVAIIISKMKY